MYPVYDGCVAFEIRLATNNDIASASSILIEAAHWLAQTGEMRWSPAQFSPVSLEPLVDSGELYLAFRDDKAVGTMYLQPEDQVFWSDVPMAESLFIHKLAVSLNARGLGVSRALIEFSILEVRRRGRKYLRLDCRNEPNLRALYEDAGFLLRDIGEYFNTIFCRYEMKID